MKLLYLSLFAIFYWVPAPAATEPIDKIADLVRQGNVHELAKLFAPSVELTILNDENIYAKAQAELVLGKFFNQNKPASVKMLHRVNSNPNYRFGVFILTTDKGTYRVAVTIKGPDNDFVLTDMRIETEKVR